MNEEFDIAKQIADARRGREELDRRNQENSAAFDSLNSRLRQIDADIRQMREHIDQARTVDDGRDGVGQPADSKPPEQLRENRLKQRREDLRDYSQSTRDLQQLAQQSSLARRQREQDSYTDFQDAHEGELRAQMEDQETRIRRQREREKALSHTQTKLNERDVDQLRREKFLDDRDEILRRRHIDQNERERMLNQREQELVERERRLHDAESRGSGRRDGEGRFRDGSGDGRSGDGSGRRSKNPRPR